ncbi:mycofactocin-coupled SDR family oxidoreductase [Nocardia vinacea]|uniref:mycofactocin-coupled SDR family oxidoreductase n=1 Tax=Nocardia vinacea TaxID=96468 RepID=UPI0002EEF099|nr:mycofactocin-coupled SDR family oxidoreductase [Nocardia vinacea]
MGKLDGKVAFITGAARGQGRSHAVRLAEEGADIIAVDICRDIESVPYPLATPDDLEQTAKAVQVLGRRVVSRQADVRNMGELQAAVRDGVAELGRLDIVLANAGIIGWPLDELDDGDPLVSWKDGIDVSLTGVYLTLRATVPVLIEQGDGGAIVLTSSSAGLKGLGADSAGGHAYTAAKHAVVGLMRTYANSLAQHHIRVNTVHPTGVNTPMVMNDAMQKYLSEYPDSARDLTNLLPVQLIEPVDVSNAILYLVSEDARYVTGVTLPVDAGITAK